MPLHEPAVFCCPFVMVLPEQKFMKLAGSVREAAWPLVGLPFESDADCTLVESRASAAALLLPVFPEVFAVLQSFPLLVLVLVF